jgi:hypothetical protein
MVAYRDTTVWRPFSVVHSGRELLGLQFTDNSSSDTRSGMLTLWSLSNDEQHVSYLMENFG